MKLQEYDISNGIGADSGKPPVVADITEGINNEEKKLISIVKGNSQH